jgi:hypothetical protein
LTAATGATVKLPESLANTQASINVESKDDKCFL